MAILPKKLKKGDTIGIVVPSKPINVEGGGVQEIEQFRSYMQTLGLNIVLCKNYAKTDKYGTAGGTPQERADDINTMFADNSIQAIWCLQGGELINQTLEYIDFELIKKNPKLVLGKSDMDILLVAINTMTGMPTIHACDSKIGQGKEMDYEYTKQWFVKRCMQGSKQIQANDEWNVIRPGKAEGKLLGCNIQSLLKIGGTPYAPDYTNAIFFFETCQANPASLLHRLTTMKLQGCFESIQGVVIGSNYGRGSEEFSVESIIDDFFGQDIPIMKTNMFGHYQPHAFLPIGAEVAVDTTAQSIKILSDFVR